MAQATHLSEPQAQKEYLRAFAGALSATAATAADATLADESGVSDGLLLEAASPAVRIEARFADERLLISFTDLENLPTFAAQVRALSASYCADMTREFIPVVEPMSRRLRFQRTVLLDAEVPTPEALAQALTASLGGWYASGDASATDGDKGHTEGLGGGTGGTGEPEKVLRL
jgi:hypothetical protein